MTIPFQPVGLRPETPDDEPFLLYLYATTRESELTLMQWTDEQKAVFVASQFHLQRIHYRKHFAQASFDLVLSGEERAGRLYVYREGPEIRIVDIAILPEWRGRGLGTRLLSALVQEGDTAGKPVSLHVESAGRARTLYERLGFEAQEEAGPYTFFVRPPRKVENTGQS